MELSTTTPASLPTYHNYQFISVDAIKNRQNNTLLYRYLYVALPQKHFIAVQTTQKRNLSWSCISWNCLNFLTNNFFFFYNYGVIFLLPWCWHYQQKRCDQFWGFKLVVQRGRSKLFFVISLDVSVIPSN